MAQMLAPDDALRRVIEVAERLPPCPVPVVEACGAVVAEVVRADRPYPPFARAMMDGVAVRVADAGRLVPVVGQVAAGQSFTGRLEDGQCVEIMTGAPCPAGTEAVVPKEQLRREGQSARLPRRIVPGQHIAQPGSECPDKKVVLEPGQIVTPLAVAVMASFGIRQVRVIPRPRLAVITTGGELVGPDSEPGEGQIRDSNGPMLAAMACDMGLQKPVCLHSEDRVEAITGALEEAGEADIVLLTGGVSVGAYDLVPEALNRFGAELIFHKVRQKPGKPLLFARRGRQLIFGLPGNPLSSHFCFHRYVAAAVRRASGKEAGGRSARGVLATAIEPKAGRTWFVTSHVERDESTGLWRIFPLAGASSADIFSCWQANAYAEVPPGRQPLPAGHALRFTWVGSAPWPD